jgi:branched-chain amino acid transport system substrate-binding protein
LLNEWSQSVSQLFNKKFEALGGTVMEIFSMAPSTNDYRTTITKVKKLNPNAIYSPVTDGVVQFYMQLHQLEFEKPIITSDIITSEHISVSPEAFENIYQTQPLDPNSNATTLMTKQYENYFKKEIKQVLFTAWGYDGLNILAEAIKKAGTDSVKIKNASMKLKITMGPRALLLLMSTDLLPNLKTCFKLKEVVLCL